MEGAIGNLWYELLLESRSPLHSLPTNGVLGLPQIDVHSSHVTLRPFRSESEWHAPVLTEEEEKHLRASLVKPLPGLANHCELTLTDTRVVAVLMRNARISLTKLGDEPSVSTATAGRRITSLLERRVLHLSTAVDPALPGRPVAARVRPKIHPTGTGTAGSATAACPHVRGRYPLIVDTLIIGS